MQEQRQNEERYVRPGDRINLVPVDPWDLVTATGSGPFAGNVIAVDESNHKTIIFKLDKPLIWGESTAEFFRAYTRHLEERFAAKSMHLLCNMDSLSEEEAKGGFPFERRIVASKWKQLRLSLTGDITWLHSDSEML